MFQGNFPLMQSEVQKKLDLNQSLKQADKYGHKLNKQHLPNSANTTVVQSKKELNKPIQCSARDSIDSILDLYLGESGQEHSDLSQSQPTTAPPIRGSSLNHNLPTTAPPEQVSPTPLPITEFPEQKSSLNPTNSTPLVTTLRWINRCVRPCPRSRPSHETFSNRIRSSKCGTRYLW